ncbi:MAG: DUF4038 domain-containing protein [Bacteroidota bacterium]
MHHPHRPWRILAGALLLALVATPWIAGCDFLRSSDDTTPLTPTPVGPIDLRYPLQFVDGRYLADASGTPVFLSGDAAWSAIANLTREEMVRYLDDREARGVNAVYVNLIEAAFSNQTPPHTNVYGDPPFDAVLDSNDLELDFTTPNEAYWTLVDDFLAYAEARGIVVFAFPAYAGWQQGNDGWGSGIDANGPDNLRTYGTFLGARYRTQPNIVWAAGGDWGPTGPFDLVAEYDALKGGIQDAGASQLWTGHGGQESGVDVYGYLGLDMNTTYRYPPQQVPEAVINDYFRDDRLPFVFFEGYYEGEFDVTPRELRYQAYISILGGAFGHFYGNSPIWFFGDGWEDALDAPGARSMTHLASLMRSRPFARLIPDYEFEPESALRGGRGDLDTGYAVISVANDGSSLVAYAPDERAITLDLSVLADATAQLWCFDPATGASTDLGTGTGTQTFEACASSEDYVIVADAASRDFAAPGTRRFSE